MVEQRPDDVADLVADVPSDGTETIDEATAVDRPDQLALDVAGAVETVVDAGLDLDMEREATRHACCLHIRDGSMRVLQGVPGWSLPGA